MKHKTLKAFALALLCVGATAQAQETPQTLPSINVAFDVRADFSYDDIEHQGDHSGFHGRYLNVMLNGNITPQLSYKWRQRMNKFQNADNDIFAATDWIYLAYRPVTNFEIAAGKQVLLIGGYEYDAAPIDIYFASRFWNNIACYQFGATASYITTDGRNTLTFQICNSPYQGHSSSCYAYNLFWSGNLGWYKSLWSVNMIEYERGKYANFIALGNRFDIGDFNLELDIMNRATSKHKYLFSDYSIIAKAEYKVTPWMTLMGKGGYDRFRALPGAPEHLDKPFYGGGFEFFPMHGSRDLRLHAIAALYYDNEGARNTQIMMGVKWRVNLYSRK